MSLLKFEQSLFCVQPPELDEEEELDEPDELLELDEEELLQLLVSAGQEAEVPVQLSAVSHVPAEARHEVPLATKPSAGQEAEAPVQLSAVSHVPAEARHEVPAAVKPSDRKSTRLNSSHSQI